MRHDTDTLTSREYHLGEARFLLGMGMTVAYVCDALNKSPGSLRKMAERDRDHNLANRFAGYERELKKGTNNDDSE